MSHSCSRLPQDPVSWLEVLIRAGGTDGAKDAEGLGKEKKKNREERKKKVIDLSAALVCCRAALRLYQSSSNRCLKRITRSCFTQGRRSGRLHPASVTGWWGADVTGNSLLGAGAMLTMLKVSADSDALYNCGKPFENQHALTFLRELIAKSKNEPILIGLCTWCLII